MTLGSASGSWYLEIAGTIHGPFTTADLKGLLQAGKIQETHKVSPDPQKGVWTTVKQALAELPERPASQPLHSPQSLDGDDPTRHLFDALQAAREKKSHSRSSETPNDEEIEAKLLSRPQPKLISQLLLLGAITLVMAISVWGIISIVKTSSTLPTINLPKPGVGTSFQTPNSSLPRVNSNSTGLSNSRLNTPPARIFSTPRPTSTSTHRPPDGRANDNRDSDRDLERQKDREREEERERERERDRDLDRDRSAGDTGTSDNPKNEMKKDEDTHTPPPEGTTGTQID